ncbi:MAG TPA: hypothetical protein DDW52_13770 [Planctomycetaceae bacterium]|nr:hypothetical protein [Planctomycetaceae bacterium]
MTTSKGLEMARSEIYQNAVKHLSGSLDLALSGYEGMRRLDSQVRQEHLYGDIDNSEYLSAFAAEAALAELWLNSTASLLAIVEIEELFEGDERVVQLRDYRLELMGALEKLRQ